MGEGFRRDWDFDPKRTGDKEAHPDILGVGSSDPVDGCDRSGSGGRSGRQTRRPSTEGVSVHQGRSRLFTPRVSPRRHPRGPGRPVSPVRDLSVRPCSRPVLSSLSWSPVPRPPRLDGTSPAPRPYPGPGECEILPSTLRDRKSLESTFGDPSFLMSYPPGVGTSPTDRGTPNPLQRPDPTSGGL